MSLRAGLAICLLSAMPLAADAADVKVIAAAPMSGVVRELAGQFEKGGRHKVAVKFVSGPIVRTESDAGITYDLAISITPVIDALIKEGKLLADTRTDLAFAGIGVGVRAGAPKPDISTVETFRRTLLSVGSVAHSATGASGDHFRSILEKLGIAEQMQPKLRPMPADTIAQAVPSGQADMIVVTASIILGSGAELVGPIPQELQFYNTFAAAIGSASKNTEAARDFLGLLASAAALPVLEAYGMEAGRPK